MMWNTRGMRAIVRKDLKQVIHNKMVLIPLIIVPALLMVLMPLGMVLLPTLAGPSVFDMSNQDMDMLLKVLPAQVKQVMAGLSPSQQWVMLAANYLFAPMFLIVPLMVASIIGADSFVGEKERKTIEGLLYTPLTDTELFVAKLATAMLPAVVVDIACFLLYGLAANLGGWPAMGRIFFPAPTWWALVFWLGPAISLTGLGATVLVSSKAKTFMAAQQAAGFLVLPIVLLMVGQISGLFFLGVGLIMIAGVVAWLAGLVMIWIGAKTFSRGELIARI